MGKGKKKPDPRGYATTSIPSKTSEAMLAAAAAKPSTPVGQSAKDLQITEKIKAAKSAKAAAGTSASEESSEAAFAVAVKNVKALPPPPQPDVNAAIVSLPSVEESRLASALEGLNSGVENFPQPNYKATRFQLETVYETLVEAGFSTQDVEDAMRRFSDDLEAALTWMAIHVPVERLPGFMLSGTGGTAIEAATRAGGESLGEKYKTIEKREARPKEAPMLVKGNRDIVMVDDLLEVQGRAQQQKLDQERRQRKIQETKKAIAQAKASGDSDEQRRLGKLMVFLKDPRYVLPDSPKASAASNKMEPSAAEELLMQGLDDEDLQLLGKSKAPVDSSESQEKTANTVEDTNEDSPGDGKTEVTPDTPAQEDEDGDMSLGIFDEDEGGGGVAKGSGVTHGLPRFEGSIPPSWRSLPKSVLADVLKRRGETSPKYVREKDGVRVKVPISRTEVAVFQPGMKCDKPAVEEEIAAMRALYVLFRDVYSSIEIQFPPAFRDTWREWAAEDAKAAEERAELNARPRREFVSSLLEEFELEQLKSMQATSKSFSGESVSTTGASSTLDSATAVRKAPAWDIHALAASLSSPNRLVNSDLPIFTIRDEFLRAHYSGDFVVVVGETGSGKTTQIPQFLLEGWVREKRLVPRIAISEPRRVSATSVCKRVAEELAEETSGLSAYQIRGESTVTSKTCLLFCTTGILLRKAVDDPLFLDLDVVVIDEVHERSLDSDVLMVLVKSAVQQRKLKGLSPLKVVLMSATINAERLSGYFGDCPVVSASGRAFPVKQYYLEDAVEMTGYDHFNDGDVDEMDLVDGKEVNLMTATAAQHYHRHQHDHDSDSAKGHHHQLEHYSPRTKKSLAIMDESKINHILIERVLGLVETMEQAKQGAILVFLPGLKDILALESRLVGSKQFGNPNRYLIVPLHSSLSNAKQVRLVFDRPPSGVRKIVLSTNIAETGVTIPDVTVVIDTCRVNQISFNEKRGLVILSERFCSKSSADQRTGRAGRVQEGVAFRLVTRQTFHEKFERFTSPEIHRVPLDQVCLAALVQNWDPNEFFPLALDPPSPDAVSKALQRLEKLGAVVSVGGNYGASKKKTVSPLGSLLARLPVDAHIGKMVVYGALFRCCRIACTIAAIASAEKSIFRSESSRRTNRLQVLDSDLITDARVFLAWEVAPARSQFVRENHLDMQRLFEIQNARDQLLLCVRSDLNLPVRDDNGEDWRVVSAVVAVGTNLAQVRLSEEQSRMDLPEQAVRYTCADGTEAYLVKTSLGYGPGKGPLRPGTDGPRRARFFAYCERIKVHRVQLRDITPVHPAAVLLLATRTKPMQMVKRVDIDDGWAHVRCSGRTYALFQEVRKALDDALGGLFASSSRRSERSAGDRAVDLALDLLRLAE